MSVIFEYQPDISDTPEERAQLIKDAQQFSLDMKDDDDFVVVATEDSKNELFEESTSIFTIDGKKKEFQYISSFNKNGNMISFGQDALGLWWYFDRTSLTLGKNLHGPYRGKEKLLSVMEKIDG